MIAAGSSWARLQTQSQFLSQTSAGASLLLWSRLGERRQAGKGLLVHPRLSAAALEFVLNKKVLSL